MSLKNNLRRAGAVTIAALLVAGAGATPARAAGTAVTGVSKVVFVSARSSAMDVKRGLEAGAVDYFTKPVDIQTLIGRIRELVPPQAVPAG